MGSGTTEVNKLDTTKTLWVVFLGKDNKHYPNMYFVLDPLNYFGGPTFLYKRLKSGKYEIEGEFHIISKGDLPKWRKDNKEEYGNKNIIYLDKEKL